MMSSSPLPRLSIWMSRCLAWLKISKSRRVKISQKMKMLPFFRCRKMVVKRLSASLSSTPITRSIATPISRDNISGAARPRHSARSSVTPLPLVAAGVSSMAVRVARVARVVLLSGRFGDVRIDSPMHHAARRVAESRALVMAAFEAASMTAFVATSAIPRFAQGDELRGLCNRAVSRWPLRLGASLQPLGALGLCCESPVARSSLYRADARSLTALRLIATARYSSILYLSISPYFSDAPCSISLYGDRCVCGKYA